MDGGLPKIAKLNGHERRAMGDPIYVYPRGGWYGLGLGA